MRDIQPVGARRESEALAKSAGEVAGLAEPAAPGDFRNSKPIKTLVAQQPLRPVQAAGIQLVAEGRAGGGEQHMHVTTRQTERGGDRCRIKVWFVAALANGLSHAPQ